MIYSFPKTRYCTDLLPCGGAASLHRQQLLSQLGGNCHAGLTLAGELVD
jgi:hypothetical protein